MFIVSRAPSILGVVAQPSPVRVSPVFPLTAANRRAILALQGLTARSVLSFLPPRQHETKRHGKNYLPHPPPASRSSPRRHLAETVSRLPIAGLIQSRFCLTTGSKAFTYLDECRWTTSLPAQGRLFQVLVPGLALSPSLEPAKAEALRSTGLIPSPFDGRGLG